MVKNPSTARPPKPATEPAASVTEPVATVTEPVATGLVPIRCTCHACATAHGAIVATLAPGSVSALPGVTWYGSTGRVRCAECRTKAWPRPEEDGAAVMTERQRANGEAVAAAGLVWVRGMAPERKATRASKASASAPRAERAPKPDARATERTVLPSGASNDAAADAVAGLLLRSIGKEEIVAAMARRFVAELLQVEPSPAPVAVAEAK